jgi:hypothetical protein
MTIPHFFKQNNPPLTSQSPPTYNSSFPPLPQRARPNETASLLRNPHKGIASCWLQTLQSCISEVTPPPTPPPVPPINPTTSTLFPRLSSRTKTPKQPPASRPRKQPDTSNLSPKPDRTGKKQYPSSRPTQKELPASSKQRQTRKPDQLV